MPLLKVLASPFVTLHQALTVCDDCWTWNTLKGEVYEDVVILNQDQDRVTIQHKYGVASLAKADLNSRIQKSLIEDLEKADSIELYGDGDADAHDHYLSKAA